MSAPTPSTLDPHHRTATWSPVAEILSVCAMGWGILVLLLTIVLPIETVYSGHDGRQPRYSLVEVHGSSVLLPASVPRAVAITVGLLLYFGHGRTWGRWAVIIAWILAGLLLLAAVIGLVTFLIGIFVVPSGALLIAALAANQAGAPAHPSISRRGS